MERKTHTKTNHLVLPSPDGEQPAPACHWGLRWTQSQSDRGDGRMKKSPKSLFPGKSTVDGWPYRAFSLTSPMCISLLPAHLSTSQRKAWDTWGFSMWQTLSALLGRISVSSRLCQVSLILIQCSSLPLGKVCRFPNVFQGLGLQGCGLKEIAAERSRNSRYCILLLGCIQSSCPEDIDALGKALKIKGPGCFEGDKPILCDRISTTCCPGSVICPSSSLFLSFPSSQNNQ